MNSSRNFTIFILSAAVSLWLNTVYAASFDCAKTQTKVEKMICSNDSLSNLDTQMANLYAIAISNKSNREGVRRSQRGWIVSRNKCQSLNCIDVAYNDRIRKLSGSIRYKGKWVFDNSPVSVDQKNAVLCRGVLNRLDSYKERGKNCSWGLISTYPGFSQPPWKEIDPSKHMKLIYELLVSPKEPPGDSLSSGQKKIVNDFIRNGGQLLVWKTRLFDFYGGIDNAAPPGMQAIIELRENYNLGIYKKRCLGMPRKSWWVLRTYVATLSLSGPDPHVDIGTAYALSNGALFIYKGNPYLINFEYFVSPLQGAGYKVHMWPNYICAFKYQVNDDPINSRNGVK